MDRYAIFVDAGYLFAQGSSLVAGQTQKRKDCTLDEKAAIAELMAVAKNAVGSLPLLRIYWYDGGNRFPTAEQAILADTDQVKLRLGFLNSFGQQKGVDSLIITDLIELARNRAVSDAVVVSGDEDIRVGVQVAQTLGVKVHLIGIHPARRSQSRTLRQESDSTHEMDKASVTKFLTCKPAVAVLHAAQPAPAPYAPALVVGAAVAPVAAQPAAPAAAVAAAVVAKASAAAAATALAQPAPAQAGQDPTAALKAAAAQFLAALTDEEVKKLEPILGQGPGLPSNLDGRLLAKARSALNRTLSLPERKTARGEFRVVFNVRFQALPKP